MADDLMSRLANWVFARPLYALTLSRAAPPRLAHLPPVCEPGDTRRGSQIIAGTLACGNYQFRTPQPDWFDAAASRAAMAALHEFSYLSDLTAAGTPGRDCARRLITSWLTAGSRLDETSWAPEVLGGRIAAWLSHAGWLSGDGKGGLEQEILDSLASQLTHLGRIVARGPGGVPRLVAIRGLIYGAACGLGSGRLLNRGLAVLRRELDSQILADGVHAQRSPAAQLKALGVLADIRALLETAELAVPNELATAIGRMAPMLKLFRHGDGCLALFNGSRIGSPNAIDAIMARSRSKGPAPMTAPEGGFQRLAAGSTLVIEDVGGPPPTGFDVHAHAGCLAFEMSEGPDRIVVNCGASDGALQDTLRTTAAHSTLVIDDVNSSEIILGGGIGRRPTQVVAVREETDGNIWVTASHNAYSSRFGVVHRRRLYLSALGDNLRGEDTIVPDGAAGATARSFTLRFHLHPEVQASLLQNGAAVLLRLPSGGGWRFQSSGGLPQLEESVYFGDDAESRRTQQMVVVAPVQQSGAIVKWAFQKVASPR